jgi:hypothetical protein
VCRRLIVLSLAPQHRIKQWASVKRERCTPYHKYNV